MGGGACTLREGRRSWDRWVVSRIGCSDVWVRFWLVLRKCRSPSSRKVKPAEAETAGAIMAFFLCLGLALGAVFSFLFRAIV